MHYSCVSAPWKHLDGWLLSLEESLLLSHSSWVSPRPCPCLGFNFTPGVSSLSLQSSYTRPYLFPKTPSSSTAFSLSCFPLHRMFLPIISLASFHVSFRFLAFLHQFLGQWFLTVRLEAKFLWPSYPSLCSHYVNPSCFNISSRLLFHVHISVFSAGINLLKSVALPVSSKYFHPVMKNLVPMNYSINSSQIQKEFLKNRKPERLNLLPWVMQVIPLATPGLEPMCVHQESPAFPPFYCYLGEGLDDSKGSFSYFSSFLT